MEGVLSTCQPVNRLKKVVLMITTSCGAHKRSFQKAFSTIFMWHIIINLRSVFSPYVVDDEKPHHIHRHFANLWRKFMNTERELATPHKVVPSAPSRAGEGRVRLPHKYISSYELAIRFYLGKFPPKKFGLLFCFSPCQKFRSSARGRAFP